MKLLNQANLIFRKGASAKVYEVDLCQVGTDQYVVNFRYGRLGSVLKDGTKTVLPVPRNEAEQLFAKLVDSKLEQGYRDAAGAIEAPPPAAPLPPEPKAVPVPRSDNARDQAILNRLAAGDAPPQTDQPASLIQRINRRLRGTRSRQRGAWPLERVIWRAGELEISAAEPLLINLLGSGSALRDYCIAWALGRCGSQAASSTLRHLHDRRATPAHVRRIAAEALLKLADEGGRVRLREDYLEHLPAELRQLARSGPADDFGRALEMYLGNAGQQDYRILDSLYFIDNAYIRPALLQILRDTPFERPWFQALRAIFKRAEYRHDGEVFGLLAYRFEQTRTKAARTYSRLTRDYLRQRVWRTLRRLGELQDDAYTQLASSVLLAFSDTDAAPPRSSYAYVNDRYQQVHWDSYARYWAFNHILYHHSSRYEPVRTTNRWRCKPPFEPDGKPPTVREEAFPKLWEAAPQRLLTLLERSDCEPVHTFAVNALKNCPDFCAGLDVPTLIRLLYRPYEITVELAFELAQQRYDPADPQVELVLAVANCTFTPARCQAWQWIDAQRARFAADSELMSGLIASCQGDTRRFARDLLRATALPDATAQRVIERLIAFLHTLGEEQVDQATDIADTLFKGFGPQWRAVELAVIRDLLRHPLAVVQELGGDVLLTYQTPPSEGWPEDLLQQLLDSPHAAVRGIGTRLLGQLDDTGLLERGELLVMLSSHALADVREAIRPAVARLAKAYPEFGDALAADLVETLLRKQSEGVPSHVLRVLREDLREHLAPLPKATVWRLLRSRSPVAQQLGGLLLPHNVRAEELSVTEIVKLANHEIQSVRQAAWALCEVSLPRLCQEMTVTVQLLDSRWDDSRAFAFEFMQTQFGPEELTPTILVGICDGVREDVQQFGRALLTRYFQEADGQDYLLKFSEHPSAAMQLFATNYLERYAGNQPERLRELTPYFIAVLSRVNQARVAKDRILRFLEKEALQSEAAAAVVADILARQSATVVMTDKATVLRAMVRIQQSYPQIPLPIRVQTAELRHGV